MIRFSVQHRIAGPHHQQSRSLLVLRNFRPETRRSNYNFFSSLSSPLPKGTPDPYDLLTPEEKKLIDVKLDSLKKKTGSTWRERMRASPLTKFTKIALILLLLVISLCIQSLNWKRQIVIENLKLEKKREDLEDKRKRLSQQITEEDLRAQTKLILQKVHIYTGLEDERELQRLGGQVLELLKAENTPTRLEEKRAALQQKREQQRAEEREFLQALNPTSSVAAE